MANLLELYLHDFSEFVPSDIGEDGHFGYPYLAAYWQERERFPFLIRVETALAGFALVRQGSLLSGAPDVMDMAEFFVLRRWRRRGIGRTAAHALFQHFPGRWEVRVLGGQRGGVAVLGADRGRLHATSLSADGLGQRGHLLAGVPLREHVRGTVWTMAASSHGGRAKQDGGECGEAISDVVPLCHV